MKQKNDTRYSNPSLQVSIKKRLRDAQNKFFPKTWRNSFCTLTFSFLEIKSSKDCFTIIVHRNVRLGTSFSFTIEPKDGHTTHNESSAASVSQHNKSARNMPGIIAPGSFSVGSARSDPNTSKSLTKIDDSKLKLRQSMYCTTYGDYY